MKSHFKIIFLLLFALFSPLTHADNKIPLNNWVKNTLLATLSLPDMDSADEEIKNHYTYYAWNTMNEFLSNFLAQAKKEHLTIHPQLLGEPQISPPQVVSGINFWKVKQKVRLPELNTQLNMVLLVLESNNEEGTSYVVQRMDMAVKRY